MLSWRRDASPFECRRRLGTDCMSIRVPASRARVADGKGGMLEFAHTSSIDAATGDHLGSRNACACRPRRRLAGAAYGHRRQTGSRRDQAGVPTRPSAGRHPHHRSRVHSLRRGARLVRRRPRRGVDTRATWANFQLPTTNSQEVLKSGSWALGVLSPRSFFRPACGVQDSLPAPLRAGRRVTAVCWRSSHCSGRR